MGNAINIVKSFKQVIILFIKAYQYLFGYFFGHCCRFTPTCSNYAIEAIQTGGLIQGIGRMIYRLMRCHPWCEGGYDPVVFIKKEK